MGIKDNLKEFRNEHGEPGTTSPAAHEYQFRQENEATTSDKLNKIRQEKNNENENENE